MARADGGERTAAPRRSSGSARLPIGVTLRLNPPLDGPALDELFAAAWPAQPSVDWTRLIEHALAYVTAEADGRLIGYARLAWDGGVHGFLLDPTVHPDWRRRGIGRALVDRLVLEARAGGLDWLHVDFVPDLRPFYAGCGFAPTEAGVMRL